MRSVSKQEVAEKLKHRVLAFELAPGQLLDEVRLSAELGISRTPLREVIQLLCGQGYLTMEENRGAKVASMDFATLRHFFLSAPMIYAATAQLAAQEADKQQIDKLKQIQKVYRDAIKESDVLKTALQNHFFHRTIGEMAGCAYLLPSLDRLLIDHTRISQVFYRSKTKDDESRIQNAADQHDAMIAAFEQNDGKKAADLTLEHWDLSRDRMERFVRPDPFPFTLEDEPRAV